MVTHHCNSPLSVMSLRILISIFKEMHVLEDCFSTTSTIYFFVMCSEYDDSRAN